MVVAVADGKMPMPTDPLLASVYEVQVYKLQQERDVKKPDGSGQARVEPTRCREGCAEEAGPGDGGADCGRTVCAAEAAADGGAGSRCR